VSFDWAEPDADLRTRRRETQHRDEHSADVKVCEADDIFDTQTSGLLGAWPFQLSSWVRCALTTVRAGSVHPFEDA
jgi:hypothetical protein